MEIDTSSSFSIKYENSKDLSSEITDRSFDIYKPVQPQQTVIIEEDYDEKVERADQVKERGIHDVLLEIESQSRKELNNFHSVEEESKNFIDPSLLTTVHECLVWNVNWLSTVYFKIIYFSNFLCGFIIDYFKWTVRARK